MATVMLSTNRILRNGILRHWDVWNRNAYAKPSSLHTPFSPIGNSYCRCGLLITTLLGKGWEKAM
jgi:hypothetical protein